MRNEEFDTREHPASVPECDAGIVQLAHHFPRGIAEQMTGHGQARRDGIPVDEWDAYPVLQRTDTATESGLGDIAGLRSPRETRQIGQHQKIFKPFYVHRGSNPGDNPAAYAHSQVKNLITADWPDCKLNGSLLIGGMAGHQLGP
jgi:hypothetical protein